MHPLTVSYRRGSLIRSYRKGDDVRRKILALIAVGAATILSLGAASSDEPTPVTSQGRRAQVKHVWVKPRVPDHTTPLRSCRVKSA